MIKYSGPLIITLFFLIETIRCWRRWGDIIVDFGREVYVPWQISIGKTLYTDIAYFNGPLAPYLNALWFSIFGVSITTLYIFNLLIIGLITFIIYRFFAKLCDRISATLSCLVFLCIFAFSYATIFNFVSPYDHDLTYGFLSAVMMVYFLSNLLYQPQLITAISAGFCAGLVFLTKAEFLFLYLLLRLLV
jgi:4-amino-4-deoxy-L-arabinose transferase-like glycosyltransferase